MSAYEEPKAFRAASEGNFLYLASLPQEAHVHANDSDEAGWTMVHMAAKNGHTDTVRMLVKEWGADASAKDNSGLTPLLAAAANGQNETIMMLVKECGVDAGAWCIGPSCCDPVTPVLMAIVHGKIETVNCLLNICEVHFLLKHLPKELKSPNHMTMGCFYRVSTGKNYEIKNIIPYYDKIFEIRETRERLRMELLFPIELAILRGNFFRVSKDIFCLIQKHMGFWCPEIPP